MTWQAPLFPPSPPYPPPRTETESNIFTSTLTPTPPPPPPPPPSPSPSPPPPPPPSQQIVTIQAPKARYDAEGMASRIERLQKSRGGMTGSTRERLYRKLVEEGFIIGREKGKEGVGKEVKKKPGPRGGEMDMGEEGKEMADCEGQESGEMGEKGLVGVEVACNAGRVPQPSLQGEPAQGKSEGKGIDIVGGDGGLSKGISMPNKKREEEILKLGEAQLGSQDGQKFNVDSPLAGYRAESAGALVSPVKHTNSPLDLADSAVLNSQTLPPLWTHSHSLWEITTHSSNLSPPITIQLQSPTPIPLPRSQQSSAFRTANKIIVGSAQQPEQVQGQITAAVNMPPEPIGEQPLRRSTRASSTRAQTTIHALFSIPEESASVLPPVAPAPQQLPKQEQEQTIPPKQARRVHFAATPMPKSKPRAKPVKRSPSPVQVPGHSYTSTGRHHIKCKQCSVVRNLEDIARMRAELAAKYPKTYHTRTPYPDDEDWQKASMAHRSLETRNPFLGSTSASLTSEMAGHMASTGMGVRSRTEGGVWDIAPIYTGTPSVVNGAGAASRVQKGNGPPYLQKLEMEHPNIPKARQEELNWLVRTNQISGLDLLAEVALADWGPGPLTGRPVFPESNVRGAGAGPELRQGFSTGQDRAIAAKGDTIYNCEDARGRRRPNWRDAVPTGSEHVWNENRAIRYALEDIRYAYRHGDAQRGQRHAPYTTRERIPYGQGHIRYAQRNNSLEAPEVPSIQAPVTPVMGRHIFKVNQGESARWYSLEYSPTTDQMRGDYGITMPIFELNGQGLAIRQPAMEKERLAALGGKGIEQAHLVVGAVAPNTEGKAVKGVGKNPEKGVEAAPKQNLATGVVPNTAGKEGSRGSYKGNVVEKQGPNIKGKEKKANPDNVETDSDLGCGHSQPPRPVTEKSDIVKATMNVKAVTQVGGTNGIGGANGTAKRKRSATEAAFGTGEIQKKKAKMGGGNVMIQHFPGGEKGGSGGRDKLAKPVMGLFTDEMIQMVLSKNVDSEYEKAELDGGGRQEGRVIKEAKVEQPCDGEKHGGDKIRVGKSAMGRLTDLFKKFLQTEMGKELEGGGIHPGEH